MTSSVSIKSLNTPADWEELRGAISPKQLPICDNLLSHLKAQDAKSVIVENNYLDRDYSESFSQFYSKVFKQHSKRCQRVHFFSVEIDSLFDELAPSDLASRLSQLSDEHYLGFIVLRPLTHAPIGSAVIRKPPDLEGLGSHLLVRATYETHCLGATFKIEGVPVTQQDSRVGACAQACIWMAARHLYTKHREPWISTTGITDAATQEVDANLSTTLPAGSEFLGPTDMIRALRSIGREPLVYGRQAMGNGAVWVVRPHEVINRYVDSGIPVILGVQLPGESIGHAVMATGHVLQRLPQGTVLPTNPTNAEFCISFIVNDDQRGANLKMPVRRSDLAQETPYSIEESLMYLIVPLPHKVFVPAEQAETLAWDSLRKYATDFQDHRKEHGDALGASPQLAEELIQALNAGRILARTYLTYGWKYKARILANDIHDEFKAAIFYQEFPRFVWVTEFGTFDSLNLDRLSKRRIFAHAVHDPTASKFWEGRLAFHAPGFGKRWYHDSDNPYGEYIDTVIPLDDDRPYFPKLRGHETFEVFRQP